MPLKRYDRFDALLTVTCFVSALSLYTRTLAPGLLPGDSGEFQTLAHLLGHTHPTGYPVYLALAKLTTFLPIEDVAYRVNLFSALMAALAVAGVYLSGRLLVNYRILAFIAAMALAVSPTFWSQAVIAEVYTPGAAFLAFILLALLWWDRTGNPCALFLAGLLGGLSLGVHMSVALLAPAALLFLLLHWRRGLGMWRNALAGAVTGALLTMLVFWLIDLHNPPASYFNVAIEPSRSAWGLESDEIDGPLERLLFGWSARQFRSFMFADVAVVMPEQAGAYWQNLPLELGWPLMGLAVLGGIDSLIRWARVALLLLVGLAVQLICVFNYYIWDVYVFYIPSYIFLVLLSIAGMGAIMRLGVVALRALASRAQMGGLSRVLEGAVALLVFGFAIWPVFQPQKEAVLAGEVPFVFDEYPLYDASLLDTSRAVVRELPAKAIVFTDWGLLWPYTYAAHIVEGRADLIFIETNPADNRKGIATSVIAYVKTNLDAHPIFFSERESAIPSAGYKFSPQHYGRLRLYQILDDKGLE